MRKRFLKTITVLCLLCGFFVPVRVNAESSYLSYSANDCISVKSGSYQGSSFNFHFNSNVNGRFVIIKGSANSGLSDTTIYFVSDVYGNASINRDNCSMTCDHETVYSPFVTGNSASKCSDPEL